MSREQFEAWYLENWGHAEDDHETLFERDPDSDEEYYRLGVRMSHQAWQAATNAMEAKCSALAAELNAVEAIHDDTVFITDDHYEQCPPEVQKIIRSLAVMQIPAYKSFLAEVRASGVDVAIEHLINKFQGTGHIGVPVMALEWLAKDLRKGVQS